MLHTTKLLVVGSVHAVADDADARAELSCGDRDAAFVLVAASDDDVFAFLDSDTDRAQQNVDPTFDRTGAEEWSDLGEDAEIDGADPVRFYFFCRREDDRYWLHGACFAQPDGVGLAALEICPATGAGVCLLRVPRGVRSIPIMIAE